jgi:hypothetical protein
VSDAGDLERTKRRRGAHLYGVKAEQVAALLLRLKGYRSLVKQRQKPQGMWPFPRITEAGDWLRRNAVATKDWA